MIYNVELSNGTKVRIDDEDLKLIKDNSSEFMIQVKQAIIRPSFIVAITPTDEKETVSGIEIREGVPHRIGEFKKLQDLMSVEKYKKLI